MSSSVLDNDISAGFKRRAACLEVKQSVVQVQDQELLARSRLVDGHHLNILDLRLGVIISAKHERHGVIDVNGIYAF